MSNYSITDKSTPTQLHSERRKVLRPVDGDRGKLSFEVNPDRDGNGADLVLWEKRGKEIWGIPVHHMNDRGDCEAVAKALNDLVEPGILSPGPLLPTNDSISDAPSFNLTRGGGLGGFGIKLSGAKQGQAWGVPLHYLKDKEQAQALSNSLNRLLESKVIRSSEKFVIAFASEEGRNKRIRHWDGLSETVSRLADGDAGVIRILESVTEAGPKVDPKTQVSRAPAGVRGSDDPRQLPLVALDEAGIYGKDIEGLYQICGRHPGRMVAVLRALPLGLIDAPALKAALKPVGILRAGGLDVDGITKQVESSVPEFSVSRVEMDTLTGPKAPNLHADIERFAREGQGQPQPGQGKGEIGGM